MEFVSWADFFAMGGYGFYVWLSFGATFISMLGIVIDTRMKRARLFKQVRNNIERNKRMQAARSMENTL
ncbi:MULTISPECIES: heme exporter protein CcmD [Motilimonas]|uniref:Heme exporter protein D n=1 Tax=Motilimonas cestriensis TaxID=2742685 RepID=A0ABS8W933_9GAMM|nr:MULTISPECIES: heme exporter protein CcmD [Motilimonas]MCE0556269.1 heme exporter protein CcmD [Motilimonas sp. E26]MCE2595524.1 heme exporter protein CcmD [Motilimonas cestriensis]MDO6525009.1 heme exporter protein CcmD [Motilimonas sp. 1_MG-2023]